MDKNLPNQESATAEVSAQFGNGTSINNAQIGNHNVMNFYPAERRTQAGSVVISLVELPRTRNPRFTGRKNLLTSMKAKISRDDGLKRIALTGFGGIGKTQLALEYASRHAREYGLIYWLDASSHQSLLKEFESLGNRLDVMLNSGLASSTDCTNIIHRLEERADWLLIFNNAPDAKSILPFLPQCSGHTIITSRDCDWSRIAESIEVDVLSVEESVEFLTKAIDGIDIKAAHGLATRLQGLPLALEQSASYMLTTKRSCAEYVELFDERGIDLFGRAPLDYEKTIATTWEISTGELTPAAMSLMYVFAFLHADNIEESWLKNKPALVPKPLRNVVIDPIRFDDVIAELRKFSLIDVVSSLANNRWFSIHRLVQQVARTQMKGAAKAICSFALAIINERMSFDLNPDLPADWDEYARILPHAQEVLEHAKPLELYDTGIGINIRSSTAMYLNQRQHHAEAASMLEPVLSWIEIYGKEKDISVASCNLAVVYRELGRYPESLSLNLRALQIAEKIYGQNSPEIVTHLINVGSCYRAQHSYSQAESYLLRALKSAEDSGIHFELLSPLANLADLYRAQGLIDRAEPLFEKALIVAKQYEKSHPHLLAGVLASKAGVLVDRRNPSEAIPELKQALKLRIASYGKESLPVAHILGNLAVAYKDSRLAKCLHGLALKIKLKLIDDKNDPEIANPYVNLAMVHFNMKEDAEALNMINKALSIYAQHNNPRLLEEAHALDLYARLMEKIPGKHREVKHARKEAAEIRASYISN